MYLCWWCEKIDWKCLRLMCAFLWSHGIDFVKHIKFFPIYCGCAVENTLYKWNHDMWSFMLSFFHLTYVQDSSTIINYCYDYFHYLLLNYSLNFLKIIFFRLNSNLIEIRHHFLVDCYSMTSKETTQVGKVLSVSRDQT